MPPSANFQDVRRSLVAEIKRDFNVATLSVTSSTVMEDLAAAIQRTAPTCIVLMNNATVGLYREYQRAHLGQGPMPPSVVVMASFVDELRPTLVNATGIAYEVPGVTAFVDLRSVINAQVRRVGVVYRPSFRQFIDRQKQLAEREQIELVPIEVGKGIYADRLRSALHGLLIDQRVDALWMLNDNELIKSSEYLDQTWRAELRNVNVPLVVGVANLVNPRMPLGSFAVVPDHEALGLQAANLIFDLSDNGWRAEEHGVELPLSVKTLADVRELREKFGLKDDALQHIDQALE
jgi:putative ABC transport system substrate-binding protein